MNFKAALGTAFDRNKREKSVNFLLAPLYFFRNIHPMGVHILKKAAGAVFILSSLAATSATAFGASIRWDAATTNNGLSTTNVNNAFSGVNESDNFLRIPGGTFEFTEPVSSSKNFALLGDNDGNKTVLTKKEEEGSRPARFFFFTENGGGYSGIQNITFDGQNYLVTNDKEHKLIGAAIRCDGTFSGGIRSSFFTQNRTLTNGGAIFCRDFSGGIVSSTLENNRANDFGGVVYCQIFNGELANSIFRGNSSGHSGGVICADKNFSGGIANCFFEDNRVAPIEGGNGLLERYGGVIGCDGNISGGISFCMFKNNGVDGGSGGALSCTGTISDKIVHSIFSGNVATGSNNVICYGGGAICCGNLMGADNDAYADLGGSFFLNNSSDGFGGAIYVHENARLVAQSGDVVFQGNFRYNPLTPTALTHFPIFVPGCSAESSLESSLSRRRPAKDGPEVQNMPSGIYFANAGTDGAVVAIGAVDGRTFFNYDPIRGGVSTAGVRRNTTFRINPDDSHGGTVLFNCYRSGVWFEGDEGATVFHGTMVLQNGASFGAGENNYIDDLLSWMPESVTSIGHTTANAGTFTLQPDATLRVVYGQSIEQFKLIGATNQIMRSTVPVPYAPEEMRSEIGAGTTHLLGRLHFVLPPNIMEDTPLLTIPNGITYIGDAATVDVGVNGCTNEEFTLPEGQTVTLLQCNSLETNAHSFPDCHGATIPNVRSGYRFRVWTDANRLLASFIGHIESDQSAPHYKSIGDGWLAGVALVNGCEDQLAIARAGKVSVFCSASNGKKRYKKNSAAEIRGTTLVAGVSGGAGPLTFGGFVEGASAKNHTEDDGATATGSGKCEAIGGGLFARLSLLASGELHLASEFSVRSGKLHDRWDGKEPLAEKSFDGRVPYYGARAGFNCSLENPNGHSLEFYGKYLWAHLTGEDDLADGTVSFWSIDSHRVRLGSRLLGPSTWTLSPWGGAYYEREFSGKVGGNVDGAEVSEPSLKGSCVVGELGLLFRPNPASAVELALHGSLGSRETLSASLKVKYEF
ncbi:MAG: hypothetical protein LBB14_01915 [Puniceicoccales bacterium]|jgi:predicted outer membrane repeat protein|nr:hypothetical protein [Puniceicoccales bacterium]